MSKILVQTTIPYDRDDWHVGRFSLVVSLLRESHEVIARDREALPDPVLSGIDRRNFDELWLIAVDTGNGLTGEECEAISNFRRAGGGLFVFRDHMDLGSSVCSLGGVGDAHHFHSRNMDPDEANRTRDDTETSAIDWPNFHSGANGNVQDLEIVEPLHPLLRRADGSPMRYFPAHPHEGDVSAPLHDATARVIARGRSKTTGRPFNLAVAFQGDSGKGNAVAESTFHHIADYNWDVSSGCPSFVTEPPGTQIANDPHSSTISNNTAATLGRGFRMTPFATNVRDRCRKNPALAAPRLILRIAADTPYGSPRLKERRGLR